MIAKAVPWFRHCFLKVCQANTFSGALTEVKKNYVRAHFCLMGKKTQKEVMANILGCEYYDPISVTKFNLDIHI
jgi:hypothetical protein